MFSRVSRSHVRARARVCSANRAIDIIVFLIVSFEEKKGTRGIKFVADSQGATFAARDCIFTRFAYEMAKARDNKYLQLYKVSRIMNICFTSLFSFSLSVITFGTKTVREYESFAGTTVIILTKASNRVRVSQKCAPMFSRMQEEKDSRTNARAR